MHLPQVEDAITTCKQHLERMEKRVPEIEIYFTRYLLVLIHAVYEQKIKNLVSERTDGVLDKHLSSFIKSVKGSVTRRIGITELSELLGRFGDDFKQAFSKKIQEKGDAQQAYSDIISNRNIIAHDATQSITLTFGDLESRFNKSLVVLDTLAEILSHPNKQS